MYHADRCPRSDGPGVDIFGPRKHGVVYTGRSFPGYSCRCSLVLHQRSYASATVAIELPYLSNFIDLSQIKVGDHKLILISTAHGFEFDPRVCEVALPIELANVQVLLSPG